MALPNKIFLFLLLPVALVLAPFLLPVYHFAFDISPLLTVASLVFAISVGFFIATATTNYLNLQSLVVAEDSAMISIIGLVRIICPSVVERVTTALDAYATLALHFEFTEYVKKTQKEFGELITSINEVIPGDDKGLELYSSLHARKDDLVRIRQNVTLAADKIVTWQHWLLLTLLSALLVTLLLSLRDGTWFASLLISLISLAVYIVLYILYQVDNNIFLEEYLAYQNTQEVFRVLNLLPYYPADAIEQHRLQISAQDYRVGSFRNYPQSTERDIRVIRQVS